MKCNCKKSKCLKLYCECFAALRYCDSCNCQDCNNSEAHELLRQEAIRATRDRNTTAFQVKVASGAGHTSGCNCKNSMCLKKYCECFQGGAYCASICKCAACQNFKGSLMLETTRAGGEKRRKGSSPSSVVSVVSVVSDSSTPSPMGSGPTPREMLIRASAASPNGNGPFRNGQKGETRRGGHLVPLGMGSSSSSSTSSSSTSSSDRISAPTSAAAESRGGLRSSRRLSSGSSSTNDDYAEAEGSTYSTDSPADTQSRATASATTTSVPFKQKTSRRASAASMLADVAAAVAAAAAANGSSQSRKSVSFSEQQQNRRAAATTTTTTTTSSSRSLEVAAHAEGEAADEDDELELGLDSGSGVAYPFFGARKPLMPKSIALRVLDCLDGQGLYNVSQVSTLWARAVADEALWEDVA